MRRATPESRARRRWGQNFLVHEATLDRIAELIAIEPGEVILEVGPGVGGLTERLLSLVAERAGFSYDASGSETSASDPDGKS